MRAVIQHDYGTPDVLRVEDVADPTLQPTEVLIRVRASTVSTAQMALRKGRPLFARLVTGLVRPKEPIPGSELAGEIVRTGQEVTRFSPGDEVVGATGAGFGAHAEYATIAQDGALVPKPAEVSHDDAVAIVEGGLTALPFLRDVAHLQPGQRLLVNGAAGAVGSAAVQLGRHFRAEVTAVCSERSAELVRSLGADRVIDYRTTDFTALGERFDVVFDAVGTSSFSRCKRILADGGIYMTTVIGVRIMLDRLWTGRFGTKRATITFTGLRSPADKAADLRVLSGLMESGQLRAVIDRRFALDDSVEAHRYVESGRKRGVVVLTV